MRVMQLLWGEFGGNDPFAVSVAVLRCGVYACMYELFVQIIELRGLPRIGS
jgi:hypothetical protein